MGRTLTFAGDDLHMVALKPRGEPLGRKSTRNSDSYQSTPGEILTVAGGRVLPYDPLLTLLSQNLNSGSHGVGHED